MSEMKIIYNTSETRIASNSYKNLIEYIEGEDSMGESIWTPVKNTNEETSILKDAIAYKFLEINKDIKLPAIISQENWNNNSSGKRVIINSKEEIIVEQFNTKNFQGKEIWKIIPNTANIADLHRTLIELYYPNKE